MATMRNLQPGLPTPTMIPQGWEIIIIDLKDGFFTIPLAEHDKEKFVTVPSLNHAEPNKRYQWKVLPQRYEKFSNYLSMVCDTGLIKGASAI